MKLNTTKKLVLSGLFFAIGLLLPLVTGQIPTIGRMLLPMHIPVLLCGFICSWQYGLVVGLLLPITRFFLFTTPNLFPDALAMTFELGAYGLLAGLAWSLIKRKNTGTAYLALIIAMLGGRVVYGFAKLIVMGLTDLPFTWEIFLAKAFVDAIPGIVLQLIFIPGILLILGRSRFIQWDFRDDLLSEMDRWRNKTSK